MIKNKSQITNSPFSCQVYQDIQAVSKQSSPYPRSINADNCKRSLIAYKDAWHLIRLCLESAAGPAVKDIIILQYFLLYHPCAFLSRNCTLQIKHFMRFHMKCTKNALTQKKFTMKMVKQLSKQSLKCHFSESITLTDQSTVEIETFHPNSLALFAQGYMQS